jgi:hypothetical protein
MFLHSLHLLLYIEPVKGAQIIVFPEYGLTTTIVAGSRPLSLAVGQDVPPLQSNPCDDLKMDSKVNTEVSVPSAHLYAGPCMRCFLKSKRKRQEEMQHIFYNFSHA